MDGYSQPTADSSEDCLANEPRSILRDELSSLLNRHSAENGSNTPDWILASYLMTCLDTFDTHISLRDNFYGINPRPGSSELRVVK